MWEVQALKKYVVFSLVIGMIFICTAGCKLDVNKISSQFENKKPSSQSVSSSSKRSENTDTPKETSSKEDIQENNEPDGSSFDTSAYQVFYVTGAETVPVYKVENGTRELAQLKSGDKVYGISKGVTDYRFVYSDLLAEGFGYINGYFLTTEYNEVTKGEVYYVREDNTPVYNDSYCSLELFRLNRNDPVTIMSRITNGYWLICDKGGTYGYVSLYNLSEEQVNETSKPESKPESRKEESSKPSDDRVIGYGEFPQGEYYVYYVAVDSGYLALRSEPSKDESVIIGEMYSGDEVYVLDFSGSYWYVYSPSLQQYGYTDSGCLYSEE